MGVNRHSYSGGSVGLMTIMGGLNTKRLSRETIESCCCLANPLDKQYKEPTGASKEICKIHCPVLAKWTIQTQPPFSRSTAVVPAGMCGIASRHAQSSSTAAIAPPVNVKPGLHLPSMPLSSPVLSPVSHQHHRLSLHPALKPQSPPDRLCPASSRVPWNWRLSTHRRNRDEANVLSDVRLVESLCGRTIGLRVLELALFELERWMKRGKSGLMCIYTRRAGGAFLDWTSRFRRSMLFILIWGRYGVRRV